MAVVTVLLAAVISVMAQGPQSIMNASAQTVSGYNYAPAFDAIGDNYIDIPDSPDLHLKQFTVAAWFKTSKNYYVNAMIVNKGGLGGEAAGQNMNYGIWLTSQERLKAGFESADGTDYHITHTNTFADGRWHYVVLSYDGTAIRLYVDGAQLSWRPIASVPDSSGTQPLRVGTDSNSESSYFVGTLDEIRVWNRALSTNEVSDQYKLGLFSSSGLVVHSDGDVQAPEPTDTTPPTITAPPDKLIETTTDMIQVDLGKPMVTDLEDPTPTVTNNAPTNGFAIGSTSVTWTAKDDAGNIATDTQMVKVVTESGSSGTSYTFCALGCDYNNLQTAINSLPSATVGKISIKACTYVIFNTITLKSNTVLDFADGASIYFRGETKPVFKGTGVNNIEIMGGEIIAERTGVKAFSFYSSSNIKITGTKMILVKGTNSNAFHCVDCNGVYISNIDAKVASRIVDIKSSSGITDGKSTNIWIQNGTFSDSSIEGIKVNHSTEVHIIGNTVSNTAENGIDIGWNKNSEVAYNHLTKTGYPYGAAIHTDSANGATIVNNYIDTTGGTAIPVYRASNIDVIGNTIIDAGDQGISIITKLEPNSNIKVYSNHIISPAGFGIYESPNQSNIEIAFNTIEQMPSGISAINVIWSGNTTTKVHDNIVK
jgi:hypothetical protein